jgi:hypothetical protein
MFGLMLADNNTTANDAGLNVRQHCKLRATWQAVADESNVEHYCGPVRCKYSCHIDIRNHQLREL